MPQRSAFADFRAARSGSSVMAASVLLPKSGARNQNAIDIGIEIRPNQKQSVPSCFIVSLKFFKSLRKRQLACIV